MRTFVVAVFVVLGLALGGSVAHAQQANFKLGGGGQPHAGIPFYLDLVVQGFDENPAPTHPPLVIDGAKLTPGEVSPNITTGIQIINGRRTDLREVTWVLRWTVVADAPGTLRVPETTIKQGTKAATAGKGDIKVAAVQTTEDMKVSLDLPQRPVFVGETIPVKIIYLFRRSPEEPQFSVPLASSDDFTVSALPARDPRQALKIPAGSTELALSYEIDDTTVNGSAYKRLTMEFLAAPKRAGSIAIAPTVVVADLQTGQADIFGNAPTRKYRATDEARTLEVKALPLTNQPPGFAGAVGEQYSIAVRTSRSVVQRGEPVELAIEVKSNQRLDNLSLGNLGGPGGLPPDIFAVPPDPPTGELADEGKTKKFTVVAQVVGPATEVPALAFSYFDPVKGAYQTIHSEPIALSVKGGGAVVGAGDVVAATPAKPSALPSNEDLTRVVAELALSSPGSVDRQPLSGGVLWGLVAVLYAIPVALLIFRTYRLRTADQREDAAEVKAARSKVDELLGKAAAAPARDVAGPLASALRDLARVAAEASHARSVSALGADAPGLTAADRDLLARLETEAFAPGAAATPMSSALRTDSTALARRLVDAARGVRHRGDAPVKAVATLLVVILLGALSGRASADTLTEGRQAYQQAMELTGDATARKANFARAQVALGDAVRDLPGRPELLADWGNAALGAGDLGTATLAYRRALALDAGTTRARKNLAWLRGRQPDAFRPTTDTGATDTLLFFHTWPRGQRILVGGIAFALAVLLLVPWGATRRRALRGLAVLPAAIWLAMLGSLLAEDRHPDDAVVLESIVMRAADSAGAPAAISQPVPVGAEVTILEHRDAWARIQIANGTVGWVPRGAVERVTP